MSLVAGIDIGSVSAEAVILRDGKKIIGYSIVPTGHSSKEAGATVYKDALKKTKLTEKDIDYIVATGYGRISVPFANEKITEITCHAKGAHSLHPKTRTIIDIGGQDSKAIKVDSTGNVVDFAMNDKCAAGTGRFLEVMARALGIRLDDMGKISLKSRNPAKISSMCTVFAESEVVSLVAEGTTQKDIVAGIHDAISSRVSAMVGRVGLESGLTISGGVAKNIGVVKALEDKLGLSATIPKEPQIVVALGAAALASEKA
ncbi:MAG: acyl-CoA dehydratase activase [Halobacteriota archaeon]|nr:acyl-CoA dehydratase activase [Halobacteriota archaeon]